MNVMGMFPVSWVISMQMYLFVCGRAVNHNCFSIYCIILYLFIYFNY